MKNLFIPYPLALLAKENGFNKPCLGHYDFIGAPVKFFSSDLLSMGGVQQNDTTKCCAPLYQQIVDWFRERHEIHLCYNLHFTTSGVVAGYMFDVYSFSAILGRNESERTITGATYYEALNATIEKAFELIKNK